MNINVKNEIVQLMQITLYTYLKGCT